MVGIPKDDCKLIIHKSYSYSRFKKIVTETIANYHRVLHAGTPLYSYIFTWYLKKSNITNSRCGELPTQMVQSINCQFTSPSTRTIFPRFLYHLVLSPDRFFPFLFDDGEKRVWWNSIGLFVLQIPRFWELLIEVNNHKGQFCNECLTSLIQSANDEMLFGSGYSF